GAGGCVAPARTVRLADRVTLPGNPVMATDVFAETVKVVTVKLVWVWPAGTVTDGVACAADGLFVESVTETPPDGAAAVRVTVPATLVPPVTLVAPSVSDCNAGAVAPAPRLMNSVFVTPPALALMVPVVNEATLLVVTVKLPELLPAGIDTLAGTCTTDGMSVLNIT